MLIKNWSNNPHYGCMNFKYQTIEEFVGLEGNLYETLDDEFEQEVLDLKDDGDEEFL